MPTERCMTECPDFLACLNDNRFEGEPYCRRSPCNDCDEEDCDSDTCKKINTKEI
jgi:hypothetical protein